MAQEWLPGLLHTLTEAAARLQLPGLLVAVQQRGEPLQQAAIGVDAAGALLSPAHLFPVASVTKTATALALLRLVASGDADLDAPLEDALPDAAMARPGVTWRRLLSHTAGAPIDLPRGAAPYALGLGWPRIRAATLATPPLTLPLRQVLYSNIGFGLAAILVERVTGLAFADALQELVLTPLGIAATLGDAGARPVAVVGGSLGEHAGTPLESFNQPFWRSLCLPWAGLLVTAAGALALVNAFDPSADDSFLPPRLRAEAVSDQTGGLAGGFAGWMEWAPCPWGLGVELRGVKARHFAGKECSAAAWGHLGASGCLAWNDPVAGVSWCLAAPQTADLWLPGMAEMSDLLLQAARAAGQ